MGKNRPGWTSIKSTADGVKYVNIESSFINKIITNASVSKWKLLLPIYEMALRKQSIMAFTLTFLAWNLSVHYCIHMSRLHLFKIHCKPLNIL